MFDLVLKETKQQKKPKYGMVIALTALGVAVIETAAVVTLSVLKKISDSKRTAPDFDTDFDSVTEDCKVDFEKLEETPEQSENDAE